MRQRRGRSRSTASGCWTARASSASTAPGLSVVYPPVADAFTWHDGGTTGAAAPRARPRRAATCCVNVKRLHELAGQRYLIDAMPRVLHASSPTRASSSAAPGPLRDELRGAGARARRRRPRHVRRPRRQRDDRALLRRRRRLRAAVAARGAARPSPSKRWRRARRSVSADHPGGVELHEMFGDDVEVVPRQNAQALAEALVVGARIRHAPNAATTAATISSASFRPAAVWASVSSQLYEADLAGRAPPARMKRSEHDARRDKLRSGDRRPAMKARDQASLGAAAHAQGRADEQEVETRPCARRDRVAAGRAGARQAAARQRSTSSARPAGRTWSTRNRRRSRFLERYLPPAALDELPQPSTPPIAETGATSVRRTWAR